MPPFQLPCVCVRACVCLKNASFPASMCVCVHAHVSKACLLSSLLTGVQTRGALSVQRPGLRGWVSAEPGTSVLTTGTGMMSNLSAPGRGLGNHSITLKYRYLTVALVTFLILKWDFYCELYSNKLKSGSFICDIILDLQKSCKDSAEPPSTTPPHALR